MPTKAGFELGPCLKSIQGKQDEFSLDVSPLLTEGKGCSGLVLSLPVWYHGFSPLYMAVVNCFQQLSPAQGPQQLVQVLLALFFPSHLVPSPGSPKCLSGIPGRGDAQGEQTMPFLIF